MDKRDYQSDFNRLRSVMVESTNFSGIETSVDDYLKEIAGAQGGWDDDNLFDLLDKLDQHGSFASEVNQGHEAHVVPGQSSS